MVSEKRNQPPKTIWAYAYQMIAPPQADEGISAITTLLENEHSDAHRGSRTRVGRVVREPRMTHILVVSDSPEQSGEINRRLEAQLKEMKTGFTISAPMAVAPDDASLPLAPETPQGDDDQEP
ncbi:hypothetical protein ACFL6X_08995 [Candidatus Latescibacterota bacterium]